jgi:hypothetical protein
MFETLSILPISFWVAFALLIGGGIRSLTQMQDGTGLPMLAVLGTAMVWYVGDAFYNDYANYHAKIFDAVTLQGCWLQVAWFLAVFLLVTPPVHQWFNSQYLHRRSGVVQMFKRGVDHPEIQTQLNILYWGCSSVWFFLLLVALLVLKSQVIYYVFPFLGYHTTPWSHGRIGAGFDFFSILAVHLQLLVASMFGVVLALATDRRIRRQALILCLLSWPYFIFDRARYAMLALAIPAVLCWVFLRLRGGIWKKSLLLLTCFLVVNTWMKFVIANRTDMGVTAAFQQKGLNLSDQKSVHNEGLNMFEELCWISTFIDDGKYNVNWGEGYFAELVNPIPRALWPGKPLIGIDYAIARGQGGADASGAGVYATISTGLIGQGVVNFGRFLGPMAAAFLMSLWVAWLARLDLNIHALGRLPLYSLGLVLTFNLGRDITLMNLYPFVFGLLAVWRLDRGRTSITRTEPMPANTQTVFSPSSASSQRLPFARRATTGGFVKRKPFRSSPVRSKRI